MQEVLRVSENRKQLQQETPGLIEDTIAARITSILEFLNQLLLPLLAFLLSNYNAVLKLFNLPP